MHRVRLHIVAVSAVAVGLAIGVTDCGAQMREYIGISLSRRNSVSLPTRPVLTETGTEFDISAARNVYAVSLVESDTTARPLIRMPGIWPDRVTHQNVAALILAGAAGFGIVWALPEHVSEWDKSVPTHEYLHRAYSRAPVWDHDQAYWNYVVHPITGSWVYLMERNHGRRPMRGFLLSTAASIGWEYGFEAMIEQPSIQDLIITSSVGSLLGELSHKATLGMKKNGFNGLERVALTVINPAYVVWKGYR